MEKTKERKLDHIKISLSERVESDAKTGFEDIFLVHRSTPEIDKSEIDLSTNFLGRRILAPLIIAGMTGGHEKAKRINQNLALAAQELGIPMGVGSQRAAIENPKLAHTYAIARDAAPEAFLIGNLGAVQFCKGYGVSEAKKAVEMISANALAVHLNPLQEAVQPEGDVNFKGALEKISEICKIDTPIIAKETGAGIAREEALALEKAGVAAIDVGGLGGTSFAAVEHYRWKVKSSIAKTFWNWGIPTAISTIECASAVKIPIVSTGGIRSGIDAAKALAIGASACGIALPLLDKAAKGSKAVVQELDRIIEELRAAMFLAGAKNIEALRRSDVVVLGRTQNWLELRGIDCGGFARRRE